MERVTPPISLYLHPTAAGWGPLCARMLVFAGNMLAVRLFHFGNILCAYRSVWYSGNPFLLPSYPGGGSAIERFPRLPLFAHARECVQASKLLQITTIRTLLFARARECPVLSGWSEIIFRTVYVQQPPAAWLRRAVLYPFQFRYGVIAVNHGNRAGGEPFPTQLLYHTRPGYIVCGCAQRLEHLMVIPPCPVLVVHNQINGLIHQRPSSCL